MSATLMGVFGSCEVYDVGTDSYSFGSFAADVKGACPEGAPEAEDDHALVFLGRLQGEDERKGEGGEHEEEGEELEDAGEPLLGRLGLGRIHADECR